MKILFHIILTVFFFANLVNCNDNPRLQKGSPISNGVLTIPKNDSGKIGIFEIEGKWKFIPGHFILPSEIQTFSTNESFLWEVNVPGSWKDLNLVSLRDEGFGTFFIKVVSPLPLKDLAIRFPLISSAYSVWIGSENEIHNGVISQSEEGFVPVIRTGYEILKGEEKEFFIVFHVSNFYDNSGGFWGPIVLGEKKDLIQYQFSKMRTDWILFGVIFFMSAYHLGLYYIRRNDLSPLYFGLFCFLMAFRSIISQNRYFSQILDPQWHWIEHKIEYLTFYLAIPLFALFIDSIFPQDFHKRSLKYIVRISLGFASIVLFLPSSIYKQTLTLYQIFTLLSGLLIIYSLGKAIFNKREHILIFTIGFSFLFLGLIVDILHNLNILSIGYMTGTGVLLFFFSQSFLLSVKFSRAFFRVEELSSSLRSSNQRLLELDKLKDEFLANTSHELKTPLNGIIGIAESLIDGVGGELSPIASKNISLIVSSGKRLSSLVNDILDFSKMKNHEITLQLKMINLHSIVSMIHQISEPILKTKNIFFNNRIDPNLSWVEGDENRIIQILQNLIGNAIKFTEEGGIEIESKLENKQIWISIRDTGIGIPEDKIDSIFEDFKQVDASTSRLYGGTGLGLSIAKRLCELHKGKILVESEIGKGSKFTVVLPAENEGINPGEVKSESSLSNEINRSFSQYDKDDQSNPTLDSEKFDTSISNDNVNVLIVDDEPINLQVLENILSMNNCNIFKANNGMEALDLLKNGIKPDMILLDIMMPRMTGYEVLNNIRKAYPAIEMPVIILTAKNQINDLVEGFESGANDYLTKPITKKELISRMKVHIQLSKINQSYSRFVPHDLLRILERNDIMEITLGDQRKREMTILFSDIRGFTSLSETMSAQENFNFINSYLKRMGPKVRNNNGFIDKYIGDAIMALFPVSADDGINSALQMQAEMKSYNAHRSKNDYEPIQIGIGIHSGNLMLGIIGETQRMDGTVISDAVNLASRIEGLTKVYGVTTIFSEDTLSKLSKPEKFQYRILDNVRVKGKKNSVKIYHLLSSEEESILELYLKTKSQYEEGIVLYEHKKFSESIQIFKEVLSLNPEDSVSWLYLQRCKELLEKNVSDTWEPIQEYYEK
ncbi:MAG: response regulator [Leptospiraceae bacterium]|nr:response regulator [Leptospiraceae bacterium]MCP5512235.1 response regulator [Leptospiraceae bacterium]